MNIEILMDVVEIQALKDAGLWDNFYGSPKTYEILSRLKDAETKLAEIENQKPIARMTREIKSGHVEIWDRDGEVKNLEYWTPSFPVYAHPQLQSNADAVMDLRVSDKGYITSWCCNYSKIPHGKYKLYLNPVQSNADKVEIDKIIEAVAYVGVDFGYGKYEIQPETIEMARKLHDKSTI